MATLLALLLSLQVTVTVRVLHEGAAVPRAAVSAGDLSAATDSRGEARLDAPPGRLEITVIRAGFAPETTTIDVVPGGDNTVVVRLRRVEMPAEVVVVTATRSGRIVEDQPLRVETVPAEEIEENATAAPGNVTTLLEELPGIRLQASAPSLGATRLSVRGLPGRYTQVLADELPLYGEQPDGLSLLQTPPLDIAHVEVIKGTASALYGGAAIGGIVNLVSQRPGGDAQVLASQSSEAGTDVVAFAPFGSKEGWGGTLTAAADRQRQQDVDGDGWADIPEFERAVLRPRVFWNDGGGKSVLASVGLTYENRTGGTVDGGTTPEGLTVEDKLDTRRFDAGLVGRFDLAGDRVLAIHASFTDGSRDRSLAGVLERDRRTFSFLEISVGGAKARHNWLAGVALERDAYHAQDLPRFDYDRFTPGLFAQDEIDVSPRVVVSASGRVDHDSEDGSFVSPRVSALLRAGRGWIVRLSGAGGWAPATPFLPETEAAGLSHVLALSNVRAESARTGSIDVQWARGGFEASGTVFASEVQHALVYRESAAEPGVFEVVNASSPTKAYGSELLLRFKTGDLQAILSHTFVDATEAAPTGAGRRETPLTPRHSAEIVVIWEKERKGRAGVEVSYTGRQNLVDNPYRTQSASYVEVNALGEIRFGEVGLFLSALNVTDVRQTRYDPLVLPARAPDGRFTTDAWAPLAGRVFLIGLRWEM